MRRKKSNSERKHTLTPDQTDNKLRENLETSINLVNNINGASHSEVVCPSIAEKGLFSSAYSEPNNGDVAKISKSISFESFKIFKIRI